MPRIFDNIENDLLPALRETLNISERSDFCVGYFNLRGWKTIDPIIEGWTGENGKQCRLLVGMQRIPQDDLRESYSLLKTEEQVSQQVVIRLKRKLAQEFRTQLTIGAPNDADEAGLRKLKDQLKKGKVVVRLFLRHQLHAKLYLCFRPDPNNPITGFVGSSNLTFSGLSNQGELNVDVLDHDATQKLSEWFNDRWDDRWCVDITKELIEVINESWARIDVPPPYWIYVKMAYHLAEEARAGLSEFTIPADMRESLLDFQSAAVKIAARHLEKRGGVILGDVVGLGKTIMATALARVFQDPPRSLETLIICPKNLVKMWEDYAHRFRLIAKVISVTQAQNTLADLRRYRIVIIDESHNLRNREGRRWAIIKDYISRNGSKCILLSATPYNKEYLDLANQLRLFLEPEEVVGIRPEEYLRQECDGRVDEFTRRHQCPINCLSAFEKSRHPDDWRELMRLFMVRRTRSFVEKNYAYSECPDCNTIISHSAVKCSNCDRTKEKSDIRFLVLGDNTRFSFPKRKPKTLTFRVRDKHPDDQYARLYSDVVVDTIQMLHLPRYGLANYLKPALEKPPNQAETDIIDNLSRAGNRLIGFCRTNLFKRLESSGYSFLLSLRRHILRNFIFIHALENSLPIPIGTQDSFLFDTRIDDQDESESFFELNENKQIRPTESTASSLDDFAIAAADGYKSFLENHKNHFDWLDSSHFIKELSEHLRRDAERLFSIMELSNNWEPSKDEKLTELENLLKKKHPNEKVLIFSQFADTVKYLSDNLSSRGIKGLAAVTGDHDDPSSIARRFSPRSNLAGDSVSSDNEIRVLIATDVLSEGQNLQDSAIVVNFDMPWAIIRLIQRAGRVDRIGQKSSEIICYSFLPTDGVNRIIRLRERIRRRLQENAEVVGTDETFFEDEKHDGLINDLFTEKSGILDDVDDNEVDLASLAYQIWKNASDTDPALKKAIPDLSNVVFSTKSLADIPIRTNSSSTLKSVAGALVYVRTADGTDALAWVDEEGNTVTESQHEILRAAACEPLTPTLDRLSNHHDLVLKATENIQIEHKSNGGQLGRPSSARRRLYERLKDYANNVKGTLFDVKDLHIVIDAIYENPLTENARDIINRELRSGTSNEKLAELALSLHEEDRLSLQQDEIEAREPRIICSLGIKAN